MVGPVAGGRAYFHRSRSAGLGTLDARAVGSTDGCRWAFVFDGGDGKSGIGRIGHIGLIGHERY